MIFDNGKVAVKDDLGWPPTPRKQASYAALATQYGFEAMLCNGNKGLMEGLAGYIYRNVCVPVQIKDVVVVQAVNLHVTLLGGKAGTVV